jgi:hypothetical protein
MNNTETSRPPASKGGGVFDEKVFTMQKKMSV